MTAKIIVEGFKSIGNRVEVEVRPLTVLAGANSSGKSTLMQSVLLLKQTLEANFDPGPLLLNGPNVRFTSADQMLHFVRGQSANAVTIGLEVGNEFKFETRLERLTNESGLDVVSCRLPLLRDGIEFVQGMDSGQISTLLKPFSSSSGNMKLRRERFWLNPIGTVQDEATGRDREVSSLRIDFNPIQEIMHVPGLRGNPERVYPLISSGPRFPGTFHLYTASVINRWSTSTIENIAHLERQLVRLGLTWRIEARKIDDTSIELKVGRLSEPEKNGANEMVSIADVGLGVSQTLPVLVALLEAKKNQLVFIEQPEIHLHPKAQVALASILADAAKRGVLVVVETHSSLLLLAIQTLVAKQELDPKAVLLHWFQRDKQTGATEITSRELDEAGRFGDWPEDFDDVSMAAQSAYLDAADEVLAKE